MSAEIDLDPTFYHKFAEDAFQRCAIAFLCRRIFLFLRVVKCADLAEASSYDSLMHALFSVVLE